MLFDRQKRLLALLEALGGNVGQRDFQKLLFLYSSKEEIPSYRFVPYKYGGFSFTSYADKRRLTEQNLLIDDDQVWQLTPQGRHAARIPTESQQAIYRFARDHATLRGKALVAKVYREFPYYATRSEIAEEVLFGDRMALRAIEEAKPFTGLPGICTIGYEGLGFEEYLNKLISEGVTLLCDVRRNPLSRKYGFSKKTLAITSERLGIRYEHLPELGIASEERRGLDTLADYRALFAEYQQKTLPQEKLSLQKIQEWVDEGERVALTCFESTPDRCHRSCVAEAIEKRSGDRRLVKHL